MKARRNPSLAWILALLLATPSAWRLAAEEWNPDGDTPTSGPLSDAARAVKDRPIGAGFTFSMGGSSQELFQKIDNQRRTFFQPTEDNFSWLARERVNVEIKQGTLFRTFLEVQDARLNFGAGWGTVVDSARHRDLFLDVYQAYAELGLMPDIVDQPSLVFRVGRQELVLEGRHLFSENDWLNTGQTFDLARAIWRPEGFQVDAFTGWPVKFDRDNLKLPNTPENLAGVNLKALGVPFKQSIEGLLVYTWNNKDAFSGERGGMDDEKLWTLSGRAAGRFFRRWDYEAVASLQAGQSGGDEVRAWSGFANVGYTFKLDYFRTLRVAAQYSEDSGDKNPHDGTSQTFDPLFGDRFIFHSKLLAIGGKNLDDLAARLTAKVWKGGMIEMDYHFFWLNQARDALYEASGDDNRRVLTGRAGRSLAQEMDLQVTHSFNSNLSISSGLFLLEPGHYFKRTNNHSTNDASSLNFVVKTSF